MAGNVALGSSTDFVVLHIDGNRNVRDTAIAEGGATGHADNALDVRGAHHPHVVVRDVHEDLIELDVLLRVRADEIVELCVVQSVEQVNASRPGGGKTHAQPAGELGVPARHERGGLLVANLDEPDAIGARPERLHDAVDPVSRQSKDRVYAPIVVKRVDQQFRRRLSHRQPPDV